MMNNFVPGDIILCTVHFAKVGPTVEEVLSTTVYIFQFEEELSSMLIATTGTGVRFRYDTDSPIPTVAQIIDYPKDTYDKKCCMRLKDLPRYLHRVFEPTISGYHKISLV